MFVRVDYAIEKIQKSTSVDLAALQALGQVYHLKGREWVPGTVPDYAVIGASLQGILKEMGYPPEKILPILTFFIDELIRMGDIFARSTKQTALPVSLLQICDNRYVSIVEGPGEKRIMDLTTGSEVKQIRSPVVVLSVVLPKLYWLAVVSVSEPLDPRAAEVGEPSTKASQPV